MKRALIGLFVICFMAGCSGDDPAKPQLPIIEPPVRNTPHWSVEYYRLAWESRDSTRIDSVLAVDYQGTSTDLAAPGILLFTKSDEIRATHGMKGDTSLMSVSVLFGPMSSWIRDSEPSDPPDWTTITVPNAQIRLTYANGDVIAVSPIYDHNKFKLKPAVVGSDTTWQIVRWQEIHDSP